MVNELRTNFIEAQALEDQARNLCFKVLDFRYKKRFACDRLERLAIRLELRLYRRADKRNNAYADLKNFYFDREKSALDAFNAQRAQ